MVFKSVKACTVLISDEQVKVRRYVYTDAWNQWVRYKGVDRVVKFVGGKWRTI